MALLTKSSLKEQINCVAEGFTFRNSDQLNLLLETGADGFSYALADARTNQLQAIQAYSFNASDNSALLFNLGELENKLEIFRHSYKNVFINWRDHVFTLVPNALFRNEQKEKYLEFNHHLPKLPVVLSDEVKGADSRCVYAITQDLKNYFDKNFPNHRIRQFASIHLEDAFSHYSGKGVKCIVNIGESLVNIAIIDKELLFYNAFYYQGIEDLLYFILLSMEQSKGDPFSTELLVAGEVEANSAIHKILKQYIKNVNFMVTDKRIIRSEKFAGVPNHYYYHLINRLLCA
jgi:hypothetical protein